MSPSELKIDLKKHAGTFAILVSEERNGKSSAEVEIR